MSSGLYGLAQEGSLLVAVLAGLVHLNLDLMADIKIGLPFVPLGTVALAWALLGKLGPDREAPAARRAVCLRVALGALLNLLGYVLVMEAPGSEYAAWATGPLQALKALRSNLNPGLAVLCFYFCFGALLVLAALGTWRGLREPGPPPDAGARPAD
jgi:hypothetical protein